jgi:hypothetical protein
MKVHYFDESGYAYDMSQCSDDIADGDVLVVNGKEKSVAVLMGAWPICCVEGFVTDRETHFDCPRPGNTFGDVYSEYVADYPKEQHPDYSASWRVALAELAKLGPVERLAKCAQKDCPNTVIVGQATHCPYHMFVY